MEPLIKLSDESKGTTISDSPEESDFGHPLTSMVRGIDEMTTVRGEKMAKCITMILRIQRSEI